MVKIDSFFHDRLIVDRPHLKSGNHVPIAALGIVSKLSDRIPRWSALDTPLFRHNQLVA
jgi:hypothetical protein